MKNLFYLVLIVILTTFTLSYAQSNKISADKITIEAQWMDLTDKDKLKAIDELFTLLSQSTIGNIYDEIILINIKNKLKNLREDINNITQVREIINLLEDKKVVPSSTDNVSMNVNMPDGINAQVTIRPHTSTWWTGHSRRTTVGTYEDVDGEITFGSVWTGYKYRGYAMFDITNIPDNAIITGITMYFYISTASNSSTHSTRIKDILHLDPVALSGESLWTALGEGTQLLNLGNIFAGSTGLHQFYTEDSLVSDLQQRFAAGYHWWAIAFVEDGDDDGYAVVRGWNWGGALAEPYFVVTYSLDVAPAAPSNLTATTQSSTQINLSWSDNSNNETGFKIERKTGSGGSWSEIATVGANVTTYQNTSLTPVTTYYYRVRAYNSIGDSPYSNEANATTQDVAPAAPSNLTATTQSSTQINLSWSDNSNNETGFKIERKTGSGGSWSEIATVGANVTTYEDIGLTLATTYCFRVRAYNSFGNSSYSNESCLITDIEELELKSGIPSAYKLYDNYPNPFNPSTRIEFGLPEESISSLKVYDIIGNEVLTLLSNEILSAGKYSYNLVADNFPSGVYFYVLISQSNVSKQSFRDIKKMILLK